MKNYRIVYKIKKNWLFRYKIVKFYLIFDGWFNHKLKMCVASVTEGRDDFILKVYGDGLEIRQIEEIIEMFNEIRRNRK